MAKFYVDFFYPRHTPINNINREVDGEDLRGYSGLWNVKISSLTLHDVTVRKSCRMTSISLINPIDIRAEEARTAAKQGRFLSRTSSLSLDTLSNHKLFVRISIVIRHNNH